MDTTTSYYLSSSRYISLEVSKTSKELSVNILIVGKSGYGKSNLGDIIRNAIFKIDGNSAISSNDPDRSVKLLGHGSNAYKVDVRQLDSEESLGSLTKEELDNDIVVYIGNKQFSEWFRTVYKGG